jgi:ATP/maltotriose-dependent transcriptional regulator MalT
VADATSALNQPLSDNPGVASELGWTELRAGRWEAARAAFESAGETPEALEGLSWAAWWLDDAESVFAAREAAYRLYRAEGNDAAAGRMATWIAADQLDFHGAASVANGWRRRAHRLLDGLEPGPDHGWLAFHDGYVAHAAGEAGRARELARQAAELGRRTGVPDLEMLGLALEGASLVADAEVQAGMQRLDEATAAALAGEAAIPISSAWTCCFLVGACTAVLDFDRACEWCDRIAEFAERYGSRYMLGFCRAEYGAVYLWRGRLDEAEHVLERSLEDFARSRPPYLSGPLTGLAELRRRQGRLTEAGSLLEQAGPSRPAQLCRARIALDAGEPRRALELVERLRRQPSGPAPAQLPELELLVRARLAVGELDAAADAAVELRELAALIGTPPLRAAADLADGMVAAALGDHERARMLLEDATDVYERCGAPFETAKARLELAACLLALGRDERAADESAAARASLLQLGAAPPDGAGRPITPRESEVLALLVEGLTNRQIAERLVVSEHTVHRHVTNILRKLHLPSRTAAAAHAVRTGLLERPRT